jgi:hypothetical protein
MTFIKYVYSVQNVSTSIKKLPFIFLKANERKCTSSYTHFLKSENNNTNAIIPIKRANFSLVDQDVSFTARLPLLRAHQSRLKRGKWLHEFQTQRAHTFSSLDQYANFFHEYVVAMSQAHQKTH